MKTPMFSNCILLVASTWLGQGILPSVSTDSLHELYMVRYQFILTITTWFETLSLSILSLISISFAIVY